MSDSRTPLPTREPGSARVFPWLLALFVVSGATGLVYEIVWFQLLSLVIGSSTVSLGVLLGTFMGGMCLGSLLLPRLVPERLHPLRVYALLEIGIGISGAAALYGIPIVGRFYTEWVGHGLPGVLLRSAVCGICLLVPTMLMGATLPAVARWATVSRPGVSRVGALYAANLVGAVLGCFAAGFYLLRLYDVGVATGVAVAANAVVAVAALLLSRRAPGRLVPKEDDDAPTPVAGRRIVHLVIGLSGLTALGAEVVWTRILTLLLGPTVYTFSIVLAVFLGGLGLGAGIGAGLARRVRWPFRALAACQLALGAAIAWTAFALARVLPAWPIDPSIPVGPGAGFQLDLLRSLWALLPATILWGASFPLALACVSSKERDGARLVGGIYAANTVGAILGALVTSLVLIAWIGTRGSQQVLVALSAAGAGLLLLFAAAGDTRRHVLPRVAGVAGVAAVAAALVLSIPGIPAKLIGHGRYVATWDDDERDWLFVGEGMSASIAVSEDFLGIRYFHVSGKVVASNEDGDMRLQKMLGHLPALIHPDPKSVLVVGCGAGVTAGTFVLYPGIERIVISEIEPAIPSAAGKYFGSENNHVIDDPRVEIITDDARHYLQTTRERFDIITSDPIHPWVRGAAALYTLEHFERCRDRLKPGGIVTQWVPLYETTRSAVKSELATFFAAFPGGTIWSNKKEDDGFDLVLMGGPGAAPIPTDGMKARLDDPGYAAVLESLERMDLGSVVELLGTYAGRADHLRPWLEGAEINRDRNLRLQYLAGMALNVYQAKRLHGSLLRYRRFPEGLFVPSEAFDGELRDALGRESPRK